MGRMTVAERRERDRGFAELMESMTAVRPEVVLRREMVAARERAGLSQRQLAQRMGTTQSVVARLELGRRSPNVKTLMRMAQATGSRLVVRLEDRAASPEYTQNGRD